MAIPIPREIIEFVLLGPATGRRQLQDSPILGDVWTAYAKAPHDTLELLITPNRSQPAGAVAVAIDAQIKRKPGAPPADIAPLQSVIAARLTFEEVLRVVVPMTIWWREERVQLQLASFKGPEHVQNVVKILVEIARNWKADGSSDVGRYTALPVLDRLVGLAALILWSGNPDAKRDSADLGSGLSEGSEIEITQGIEELFRSIEAAPQRDELDKGAPLVFQVSLNRDATPCIARSVPAVKADAARGLFDINCSRIVWAVVDSGVDGGHPAFAAKNGSSRVTKSFDFTDIRKIVSLDNVRIFAREGEGAKEAQEARLAELRGDKRLKQRRLPLDEAGILLRNLGEDARNRRAIHWEWVRPFVEIEPDANPTSSAHGTHVAGIIGAARTPEDQGRHAEDGNGMCPDVQIYDFRVLAPNIRETEFAVIAALQFIRFLNSRTDHMVIHGANLSLSLKHDVRNYACGRTPVCIESERLVDSGVVVVAAAGNLGYETQTGGYEGYRALSITDPGNADGVITVGATHRYSPHTYGVSFFSSRGPTGDGRMKPDLVAPGERIRAPVPDGEWAEFDGTSMAAPHVSGAAAMLMARYPELIGQPRRIKRILCDTATDLGRERNFQGYGMLDVLRALQSI